MQGTPDQQQKRAFKPSLPRASPARLELFRPTCATYVYTLLITGIQITGHTTTFTLPCISWVIEHLQDMSIRQEALPALRPNRVTSARETCDPFDNNHCDQHDRIRISAEGEEKTFANENSHRSGIRHPRDIRPAAC